MKSLILFLLFLISCTVTHQTPEKPVEVPSETVQVGESFKGKWNRADWDQYLIRAIEDHGKNLLNVVPLDYKNFIIQWPADKKGLIKFWGNFAVEVAKWESSWKPETKYRESFGVWSRGLFQISKDSANQSRYNCGVKNEEDLHLPQVNIPCFIKIIDYWVGQDKRIAGKSAKKEWIEWRKKYDWTYYGCGRYFSVCRDYRPTQLNGIMGANK